MNIEIHIDEDENEKTQVGVNSNRSGKRAKKGKRTRKEKRRHRMRILLWVIGILVVLRIALPYVVLYFANKKLATLKGYYGHIDDIDISLYRGAYSIKHLQLKKIDKKDTVDFVSARIIDLAIEWKPLWHGQLVGKVDIDSAAIVYTEKKNDWRDIAKDTANFRDVLNSFMPLTINKLEVRNSSLRYRDPYKSPRLDIPLTHVHVLAKNLVNAYDSTSLLPATIDASGGLYKGKVEMHMKIDPFAKKSTFDMNTSVKHVNMVALNDLLRAYGNFDVNRGDFSAYVEMATKDGKVDGYVKPLISDLDIVSWNKSEGNFGQIMWETVVAAGAWVFKNHPKDQLGTKVYLHGNMKDPKVSVGKAILILLQNAFVSALRPYIDGEININSVKNANEKETFIDKIIDKRHEKKQERAAKKAKKAAKKKS